MSRAIQLSDGEWEIIAELLEQERGNLRPEIRHTDSPTVHDELQKRLATVNALSERMKLNSANAAIAAGATR